MVNLGIAERVGDKFKRTGISGVDLKSIFATMASKGESFELDPLSGKMKLMKKNSDDKIDNMDDNMMDEMISQAASARRLQNRTPEDRDFAAVHFNKKALVDGMERAALTMTRQYDSMTYQHPVEFTFPGPAPTNKKQSSSSRSISQLKKCSISDLTAFIGRHATGMVLYGTLCALRPIRVRSLMTILADDHGKGVEVALYNNLSVQLPHWQECFPRGMKIGIVEPFLKWASDGTIMIRVEDPNDIVYMTPVCSWRGCRLPALEDGKVALKACARCKQASYCGKECQRKAWKDGHKESCKKVETD